MNRLAKILIVALSVAVFCYVGLGYVLGKTGDDKTYRSLTVYGEVLQHIQEDYVEEPNMQLVTAGALHGLLESLDPLSGYLSPREYTDYKEKAKSATRGDVGVTLSKRYGYVDVISVLPDSPAEKAGIRSGDLLEAIAGFATRDMSVGQANLLLDGAPGTVVKVAVVRVRSGQTEPQQLDLVRVQLPPLHVWTERLEGDVAYLRVPTFEPGTAEEIRDKVVQLDRQGIHKLVLDLRHCARGSISEGVAAAQLFLPSGTIGTLRGQVVARQEFSADPSRVVWKEPLEVLISNSTAGAAEVLAAAIGDNHRGDLVGERTFGTASEQKVIPLDDGAALILTVAYYYTPSGKSVLEDGVAPTVDMSSAGDDFSDGSDLEQPAPPLPNQPPSLDDPVLKKAIELLNQSPEARKAA